MLVLYELPPGFTQYHRIKRAQCLYATNSMEGGSRAALRRSSVALSGSLMYRTILHCTDSNRIPETLRRNLDRAGKIKVIDELLPAGSPSASAPIPSGLFSGSTKVFACLRAVSCGAEAPLNVAALDCRYLDARWCLCRVPLITWMVVGIDAVFKGC